MNNANMAQRISLSQAKSIDLLCDEFEADVLAGRQPRIEDFAARVTDAEREAVLRELLGIELHHRRRRGEVISPSDYDRRFPEWRLAEEEVKKIARADSREAEPRRLDSPGDSTVMLPSVSAPPQSSRYAVMKMHARGGMGEIWLADDLQIGRRVAYKRIRAGREHIQERFIAEAQITGQLEHPGVVPVHEFGHDADGNLFYVMRLIQGRTLKKVIGETHAEMARQPKSRELCWVKLLEIFLAVCRTVAYAHHRGVIHRDIKPENIMIGSHGETLIVDWGLAKLLETPDLSVSQRLSVRPSGSTDSTSTQDGNVLGSPQYMSPEMAEGRIGEGDEKTDIYLLGATLYEILTCRPPRQGSSNEEMLNLARTTPPKAPRQVNPCVPHALEAICLRAMDRNKGARYESAEELAAEVERYLAGDRVLAHAEPWTDKVARWVRRHRRALGRTAVAAIVGAVMLAAGVAWRQADLRSKGIAEQLAKNQRLDQAKTDHSRFEKLSQQLHYALADTAPLDDTLSFTDPGVADKLKSEIGAIAARWKSDFSEFPLVEERDQMRRSLAELTLWRVQEEVARPAAAGNAKQLLADLDAIATLNPSPASYHRLRSTCLLLAGETDLANVALTLSKQAKALPYDHFLEGERLRAESLAQPSDEGETSLRRPSRVVQQKAIAAYRRCLELDPKQFWAHLQKGRCHLLCEESDEALAEFNLAVALQPELPWAWSVRGFAEAILGIYPAAERDLNYALLLDPQFDPARLNRGVLHLLRNDVVAAREEFELVAKSHPESVQASYYLAKAEQASGNHGVALKQCQEILNSHPHLAAPRFLCVQAHLALGHADLARSELDRWLAQTAPNLDLASPAASARRCQVLRLLAIRQSESVRLLVLPMALKEGRAAVEADPTLVQAYVDLAEVLLNLGQGKQAITVLDDGLRRRAPDLTLARMRLNRGLALVYQADYARAKEDYSVAARLSGLEPMAQIVRAEAHAMLGYIAARQSKPAEAQREAALSMSQLRNANNFTVWINLACVYNALADAKGSDSSSLQDAAMAMLANAMFQSQRTGRAKEATRLILDDDALKSLQSRPDFREVVPNP